MAVDPLDSAEGQVAALVFVAGCEVLAFVNKVRDVGSDVDLGAFTMEDVESNMVRCPDQAAAERMIDAINEVRTRGESTGGEVTCVVRR